MGELVTDTYLVALFTSRDRCFRVNSFDVLPEVIVYFRLNRSL